MPAPVIDQAAPLDLTGVEMRERHGYTEATCKCGAWLRMDSYKGDRIVMYQMAHVHPCAHYEQLRMSGTFMTQSGFLGV